MEKSILIQVLIECIVFAWKINGTLSWTTSTDEANLRATSKRILEDDLPDNYDAPAEAFIPLAKDKLPANYLLPYQVIWTVVMLSKLTLQAQAGFMEKIQRMLQSLEAENLDDNRGALTFYAWLVGELLPFASPYYKRLIKKVQKQISKGIKGSFPIWKEPLEEIINAKNRHASTAASDIAWIMQIGFDITAYNNIAVTAAGTDKGTVAYANLLKLAIRQITFTDAAINNYLTAAQLHQKKLPAVQKVMVFRIKIFSELLKHLSLAQDKPVFY